MEKSSDRFKRDNDIKSFTSEIKENFGNIFETKQIEEFSKLGANAVKFQMRDNKFLFDKEMFYEVFPFLP